MADAKEGKFSQLEILRNVIGVFRRLEQFLQQKLKQKCRNTRHPRASKVKQGFFRLPGPRPMSTKTVAPDQGLENTRYDWNGI